MDTVFESLNRAATLASEKAAVFPNEEKLQAVAEGVKITKEIMANAIVKCKGL
jgi:hypothetical protein